jgi:hypothetical protein
VADHFRPGLSPEIKGGWHCIHTLAILEAPQGFVECGIRVRLALSGAKNVCLLAATGNIV